jgi:hypothetical protein
MARAEDEKPVVVILPFKNESNKQEKIQYEAVIATGRNNATRPAVLTVDRYTEAPRTLFESALVKWNVVDVVERKRLDAVLKEEQFGGVIGKEPAEELAKKLGASRLILGTITNISEETRSFVDVDGSYGMRGMKVETILLKAKISVRVVELPSGKILTATDATGSKTLGKSTFGGTSFGKSSKDARGNKDGRGKSSGNANSDAYFVVIEDAIAKLAADEKFKAAVAGKAVAQGMVDVEFAPTPEKCNIEIDGKYKGSSAPSLKVQLKAGTEYKVRITKAGYKEWMADIVAEPGLKITPELEANK